MKHEKNYINIFTIVIGLCIYIFTGCQSTNYRPTDDVIGRAAISTLGKLETELEHLDRRIERCTDRAEDIEGEAEIITELLREYVRYVSILRSELERYRIQVERNSIQTSEVMDNNNSGDSSFHSN